MEKIQETKDGLQKGIYDGRLKEIYVDESTVSYHRGRYIAALDKFQALYGDMDVEIFSAPGRSEVCGNHTDHQNGRVLATSINLDAIAVVAPLEESVIRLVSDEMPEEVVDINDLEKKKEEEGTTTALLRGVAAGIQNHGFHVGGFCAYITSDVLMGAGMSSSAAFECLIGTILLGLYNDMEVPSVDIAKIGQYAENIYFGKPCGLMDQMACAVGGLVYIDFKDSMDPAIERVHCDFEKYQYSLCIVDTKGSHADLTDDYAAIPKEMRQVAGFFGKNTLQEVDKQDFFAAVGQIREMVGGRALLRAMHFFAEQDRVVEAVDALKQGAFDCFLDVIKRSGDSSSKLLQNIYSEKDVYTQNVSVALATSECFLQENGVCRVHGGGFAGTIQAFVKNEAVSEYKAWIERIFGEDSCHVLKVRPYGGIKVLT